MSVEVVTFGCRLNAQESDVIRAGIGTSQFQDAVVFNTCAVTGEAERQARQAIRRMKTSRPQATIIVTGCSAQRNPSLYAGMEEVDYVIGNEEKLRPATYAAIVKGKERIHVGDILSVRETAPHWAPGKSGRGRAFLPVQTGCDHRCTFCVIPFGRGNSRSVPVGEIAARARTLLDLGNGEIVLTGVDLTAYGRDLPGSPTLGQMMRRLLALLPDLKRLRLSSIDAVEVDGELLRLIAEEPRLMPHLHLSLQSGHDLILKRMKRRHSRNDAIAFCTRVRELRPGIVFGADFIVGFPTETKGMFQATLDLVDEAGLTYLHVFPYSPREGTPAARMPQVDRAVRKERAALLREKGERRMQEFFTSLVGIEENAVMEAQGMARTDRFVPVHLEGPLPAGDLARLRIERVEAGQVHGRFAP